MVELARTIHRDFTIDGVPSSLLHDPVKRELREWGTYIESLTQAANYGNTVWFATKALLLADLDHDEGTPAIVYADTTAENNGIYIKAGASGAGNWNSQIITYLPGYQFVTATNAGAGTADAIVATTSPRAAYTDGVQLIRLNITADNTSSSPTVAFDGGAALEIVSSSGSTIGAGGLVEDMSVLGVVDQSATVFRLLSDQVGSAIATAAQAAQTAAETAQAAAEAAAAGVNLPSVTSADRRKTLAVNSDNSGYELRPRRKRLLLAYSQSNFSNASTVDWVKPVPPNLFVWNGGNWNGDLADTTGDAFEQPDGTEVQVPVLEAAEHARNSPEDDFYLIVVARGGTSVRAMTGMNFQWDSGTSGDPGAGHIGFDNATPASITEVRYSETDDDGYTRFVGTSSLSGASGTTFYPARIEEIGDEANTWIEFDTSGSSTDNGSWRDQTASLDSEANWPPADNTPVRVFPADPRMQDVLTANVDAAFTALGLATAEKFFDRVFLWPTEGDLNYEAAYRDIDFPALLTDLSAYTDVDTAFLMTLPWPQGAGIAPQREEWWDVLRELVADRPDQFKLVGLAETAQADWDSGTNYVHVAYASMEAVAGLIRASEQRGGTELIKRRAGSWTPTLTGVANVTGTPTLTSAFYQRIGNIVHCAVQFAPTTTSNTTLTQIGISLPVPSAFTFGDELNGIGVSNQAGIGANSGWVTADTTNDRAQLNFLATAASAQGWHVHFSYEVIQS